MNSGSNVWIHNAISQTINIYEIYFSRYYFVWFHFISFLLYFFYFILSIHHFLLAKSIWIVNRNKTTIKKREKKNGLDRNNAENAKRMETVAFGKLNKKKQKKRCVNTCANWLPFMYVALSHCHMHHCTMNIEHSLCIRNWRLKLYTNRGHIRRKMKRLMFSICRCSC